MRLKFLMTVLAPLVAVGLLAGVFFRLQRSHTLLSPATVIRALADVLPDEAEESDAPGKIEPARVEPLPGTDLQRVILTAKAAERLGITTAPVRDGPAPGGGRRRTVIPYAAVIYDTHGVTWTYTNPESLVFLRRRIRVDSIDGDRAVLADGPPVGTAVVTAGAAELFGAEFGVGK